MFNLSLRVISKAADFLTHEFIARRCRSLPKHYIFMRKQFSSLNHYRNPNILVSSNCRYYAKSRDIRKEKNKQIKIDENELQEYLDVEKLFTDLGKPVQNFKEELVRHATLRTSPNVIESVKINFEGDNYTIRDLAEIGKKNPKLYVLDFSAFPGVIPTVVSTLQKLELNLNVQQDGTKVFVPIPNVTKEHRENLAKKSKMYFFKCKDSVRNVEITYKKKLDKIEKLPNETKMRITDQLTALGDKYIHSAEEILKAKHQELLKE